MLFCDVPLSCRLSNDIARYSHALKRRNNFQLANFILFHLYILDATSILFLDDDEKALQRVFFAQEQYTELLRLYNGRGEAQPPVENVACEWMKLNIDVWSQWKPADLTAKTELYIGGIFPISGPFYKSGRGMVPGWQNNFSIKSFAIRCIILFSWYPFSGSDGCRCHKSKQQHSS